MPLPIFYTCPVCYKHHDTAVEAEACRDQPMDYCGLVQGSIVVIPSLRRYRIDDIRPGFVAFEIPADPKSSSHFDHTRQFVPYCVVTGLHASIERRERHRPLVTVAVPLDDSDYFGWNPANGDGHYAMLHPGKPLEEQPSSKGSYWAETLTEKYVQNLQPPAEVLSRAKSYADGPLIASPQLLRS